MAQQYQNVFSQSSRTRTIIAVSIAIIIVLIAAVTSGVVFGMHDESRQRSLTDDSAANTSTDRITSTVSDTSAEQKVEPVQAPSANEENSMSNSIKTEAVTNSNSATTTVTVNGQSVTVNGEGEKQESYISDNGRSKVDISIKHVLTDVRKGLTLGN